MRKILLDKKTRCTFSFSFLVSDGLQFCSLIYQMVRFTPAHMEVLVPCAARTSSRCSLVSGILSKGSGLERAPSLGLATTTGSGPWCELNSTTWSFFLSASAWNVSCREDVEVVVRRKIWDCSYDFLYLMVDKEIYTRSQKKNNNFKLYYLLTARGVNQPWAIK